MTVRNLDKLLKPKSVALIGASKRDGSLGKLVAGNLFRTGFDGPIMPVNPNHTSVEGVLTYPDVKDLPITPDLAVIATPPATVPGIVAELASRGTRGIVVITAGLDATQKQAMLDAARPTLTRIIGPNCLGLMRPPINLNAGFAHLSPSAGKLAFLAQSGAVVTSVIDWAKPRGIGFSHLVSLGDMADVDFGDMLDYLADDAETSAILLYMETVTAARKFMSAGRAAARSKPVIVVKAGRHSAGAAAAASHTGALAGADEVYETAFSRAGMLRVLRLETLFDMAQILALRALPKGERLMVVTNGGGAGVLAADSLTDYRCELAELDDATIQNLDKDLPATWSRSNPIDIIGDATSERYEKAITALADCDSMDGLLVLNCPTAVTSPSVAARAVANAAKSIRKPVFTAWLGDQEAEPARRICTEAGITAFATPEDAVQAFANAATFARNQRNLLEAPQSMHDELAVDFKRARAVIERVVGLKRDWLSEIESKALIKAYGIETPEIKLARDAEEAVRVSASMNGPVVLKIVSPDIVHKSDLGGVVLDLEGDEMVRQAATTMLAHIAERAPDATLTGVSVQPMVRRPGAVELLLGMIDDTQFGPVMMFGQGGVAVEVLSDTAMALPPLNTKLAMDLISRTRIYRLLKGYRDKPPAALDAIIETLLRLAQLVIDHGEIETIEINPLLVDDKGVTALDVRVKLMPFEGDPSSRLCIRPYPKELEEEVVLEDGRLFRLRPIRPEDGPALRRAFATLNAEEIRFRFFSPMTDLPPLMAARFSQIDYDRAMAFLLSSDALPGDADIFAVVQITADPDNTEAEFAIIVHHDLAGQGLGRLLLGKMIAYARNKGLKTLHGLVLAGNRRMLHLCKSFGFREERDPDDTSLRRVVLKL